MKFNEITPLTDSELKVQEAQTGEQLFRLRFQKSLGNTEGTNKLRTLRKDIARMKTASQQRALLLAAVPAKGAAPAQKTRTVKKDA